jgi:hypothetical protein
MKKYYKKAISIVGIVYLSHIFLHIAFPLTIPHLLLDLLTLFPVVSIFIYSKFKNKFKKQCDCECHTTSFNQK